MSRVQTFVLVLWSALLGTGSAFALPPENADRIDLRLDCTGQGSSCVQTMQEVVEWFDTVRSPTAPPVLIDIGPGEFGAFYCTGQAKITLRGSGRGVTTIADHYAFGGLAINFLECDDVELQDLTVLATTGTAIQWSGPGTSIYTNIEVIGGSYAWAEYDFNFDLTCPWVSEHWSWNSTWRELPGGSAYVWVALCSRTFFYGSELLGVRNAITMGLQGEVRLYGSVAKAVADSTVSSGKIQAVIMGSGPAPGGILHMHGGIIVADASAGSGNIDAIAIAANAGSFAHTLDTAFLVKGGGTGKAQRLSRLGTGKVEAPTLLGPGNDIPNAGPGGGPYVSEHGQDLFVETDCSPNGDCSSGGGQTHLMVYNANCATAGPWFNTVTKACRGVIVP